ncbi:MAG: hypothetical protein KGD74_09020 [Candidatus Lokiarchaeota archaeon]|nr:hypothetical protein [Candidatus Lokiarchaeota archaeon]
MVFKINRQKLRNYLFIFSIALTLFFLGSVTTIVFNFEESLNIGYFRTDRDYRTTYGDGYGELNMDLQLDRYRDDRYDYILSCHFSSGGVVEIVGLKQLNYTLNIAGTIQLDLTQNWDPPTEQFTRGSTVVMYKTQVMTWSGSAEVLFISNNIVQNETIEFTLGVTVTLGSGDYFNVGLISYVVLFSWLLAFPVLPLILKAIFKPYFGFPIDEETRKRDEKYVKYLQKTEDKQA